MKTQKQQLAAKDVLPNTNCMQAAERVEKWRFFVCDLNLDPSNLSEWGTKHIFCMNLAQICSAVPEIFHIQTKKNKNKNKKMTAPKTEPSAVHCMP